MIAGGYTLHLYCEHCGKLGEFVEDQTKAKATQTAKRAGWTIDWPSRRAWCPRHHKEALEALGIGTSFRKGPRYGRSI